MKRRDLIKLIEKSGGNFVRHGADHDIYECNGKIQPIKRHREIDDITAKKILKALDIKI